MIGSKADRIPNHSYIYAAGWENRQIAKQCEFSKKRKGWEVFEIASGHDIMIGEPNELARVLASVA